MLIALIISALLFGPYVLLILFYRRGWLRLQEFDLVNASPATTVSVIIPARNEERNIVACIGSLYEQDYPKHFFEIIVVDDHSTDNTWNLLENLRYPGLQLKTIKLSDHFSGAHSGYAYKKLAIETAISNSVGDLIVTTDADCTYHTGWLRTLAGFYEKTHAKFIAAPVKITCKPTLLDIFQTLDFATLQGITGASVFEKFHSMCNGANLAYEKRAFLEVGGFRDIDSIPSGDDLLLMHKMYTRYPENVFYLKSKMAIVNTLPQRSWRDFFNQRIRWASKADRYDDKRIFWVLVLVYCFNLSLLVLVLAACWNIEFLFVAGILLVLKTVIECWFLKPVAAFFEQQSLMLYFPILQPLHILYVIVSGFFGRFGAYQWKGRRISRR